MTKFEIYVGNIADVKADAIVNAANAQLAAGGGVCGAIFSKAGPGLASEIAASFEDGCPTGQAVYTNAYKLDAKVIVHAVAPIFYPGQFGLADEASANLLASAYKNAIEAAWESGAKSVAIPALGTGIYGWDMFNATPLAKSGIFDGLREHPSIEKVIFCLYDEGAAEVYREMFRTELEYGLSFGMVCPKCGGKASEIVYGMVMDPGDDVYLGGCTISPGQPNWACKKCDIQFG